MRDLTQPNLSLVDKFIGYLTMIGTETPFISAIPSFFNYSIIEFKDFGNIKRYLLNDDLNLFK